MLDCTIERSQFRLSPGHFSCTQYVCGSVAELLFSGKITHSCYWRHNTWLFLSVFSIILWLFLPLTVICSCTSYLFLCLLLISPNSHGLPYFPASYFHWLQWVLPIVHSQTVHELSHLSDTPTGCFYAFAFVYRYGGNKSTLLWGSFITHLNARSMQKAQCFKETTAATHPWTDPMSCFIHLQGATET